MVGKLIGHNDDVAKLTLTCYRHKAENMSLSSQVLSYVSCFDSSTSLIIRVSCRLLHDQINKLCLVTLVNITPFNISSNTYYG